jgi:hypothetical protein
MPDGYTVTSPHGQALSGIAGGLMDTFFSGLAKQKDDEKADKEAQQKLQLVAIRNLIDNPNTKVGDIPTLMQMHADIAGIGKDPHLAQILQGMKQSATAQVPYGPEQETTDSQVSRLTSQFTAPQATTDTLATTPTVRPPQPLLTVPGEPAPVTAAPPSSPPSSAQPLTVSTPALKVVPPEPQMFQPTRVAGDLTQDDLEQNRKSQFDLQHQMAMLKRESELADQRGDRQTQRDVAREMGRLKDIEARGKESRKTQDQLFDNKLKMLEPEMQAHAGLRKAQIAVAITAQNPGMDPAEVDKRAGDMAFAEIQVGVAQKQAQIEKSKAEITHWKNIDAMKLVSKGGDAVSGMSAGQARLFRLNTLELMPELNSTRNQLEKLKSDQALMGGQDPAIQQRITELSDQQDKLLLRLKEERDKVLSTIKSSPSTAPATPFKPAQDGKYHYTPDQIRGALKPGQTYDDVVRQLSARPNVIIDQ